MHYQNAFQLSSQEVNNIQVSRADLDQQIAADIFSQSLSQAIQMTQSLSLSHESEHQASPSDANDLTPRVPYPPRDHDPLSEFTTAYLASKAFPTLFPTGAGDPWRLDAYSDANTQLMKFRHLLRYCEEVDGKLEFRFAQHPRFVLWVYNIHYRHRTLSQGDIYLQQNPEDANLTIEEIQQLLQTNDSDNSVLKRIRHYMANIPGSPSYWHNVSCDLKAIIDSKGPPTVFFTLSFADTYN